MEAVLSSRRPRLSTGDAAALAIELFQVSATAAVDLGSERDQTFAVLDGESRVAILKVSNHAERAEIIEMERAAAAHAADTDDSLTIAQPLGTATLTADHPLSDGDDHCLRLYPVLAGRGRCRAADLTDTALVAWGATSARLARALRSFFHPAADREMLWDVHQSAQVRPMVEHIVDTHQRTLVTNALDRFAQRVQPRRAQLRSQAVHGDLTTDNVLVDDNGLIVGIVDFGDMCWSSLVADLAAVLDSLCTGRAADLVRVARLTLDGYQSITPLEPIEIDVLGDVWAARCAVGVAIASWRATNGLEDVDFATRYNATAAAQLQALDTLGAHGLAAALNPTRQRAVARPTSADLQQRRDAVLGPTAEALFYDVPIQVASATGCTLTDVDGREYLDVYNNVPCVGHAHPRVTEAIATQARLLNTNMRYLHDAALELAERLTSTMPTELDTVLFFNSGSEANDVAIRLAKQFTGNVGLLCTAHAYHGITEATAAVSPETWAGHSTPPWVATWQPPDARRGQHLTSESFAAAIATLHAADVQPAAVILDGVLQSDGVLVPEPAYVANLKALAAGAGAVWIADEVQGGHGRTGQWMWSFERFGIVPDIVTMGKPMGNGHPVAALVTRREIAAAFAPQGPIFSTFGGNQVSVAAARAVLDVLDDERVLDRVQRAGRQLRDTLTELCGDREWCGEIRGVGLANAVDIVTDRDTLTPDRATAHWLRNELRQHGVLVGATGPHGNVIKIRPPLAFTDHHCARFGQALRAVLASGGPARQSRR